MQYIESEIIDAAWPSEVWCPGPLIGGLRMYGLTKPSVLAFWLQCDEGRASALDRGEAQYTDIEIGALAVLLNRVGSGSRAVWALFREASIPEGSMEEARSELQLTEEKWRLLVQVRSTQRDARLLKRSVEQHGT